MLLMIFSLMISILMSFLFITNPMSLALHILILSLISSFMISFFSSWMAIIMFLIYSSGMLIMFIYFSAISTNKKLEFINSLPLIMFLTCFFMMASMIWNMSPMMNFMTSYIPSMIYFLLMSNANMLMFLIFFLFISLIIVVKISMYNKSPLRPFKYV